MPSADIPLTEEEQRQLKDLAYDSIRYGLQSGYPIRVDEKVYSEALVQDRAAFVTLHREGKLRGCVGSLEARRSLVLDVAENAFAAAFRDSRFEPLRKDELPGLDLHISVLSPPVAMEVHSEEDLLTRLQPGRDGLILEKGTRRATFLPSVWAQVPEPADFVKHLKRKAGMNPAEWDDDIRVFRYTSFDF